MPNNSPSSENISIARDFAESVLYSKPVGSSKKNYIMLQISKFLLLKESIIKKDCNDKILYFDIDGNEDYLDSVIYIVELFKKNGGTIKTNSIPVVISNKGVECKDDGTNHIFYNFTKQQLIEYVKEFQKIRDAFAHGAYHIDCEKNCIEFDNCGVSELGEYELIGSLPVIALEKFNAKITEQYYNVLSSEFFPKESLYNNPDLRQINNSKSDLPVIDSRDITEQPELQAHFKVFDGLSESKLSAESSRNNEYIEESKAMEKELNSLLQTLLLSKNISIEYKTQIVNLLHKYELLDIDVVLTDEDLLDKIYICRKDPDEKYIYKIGLVIDEIASLIGIGIKDIQAYDSHVDFSTMIAAVYNYMQIYLSFELDNISSPNKQNLGMIRMSKLNPQFTVNNNNECSNNEYAEKINKIKRRVDKYIEIMAEKIELYNNICSPTLLESILRVHDDFCVSIVSDFADKNRNILNAIRNSLDHGNVRYQQDKIMLFDRADQTKEEIEFVCNGKPEEFFEIIKCIELDQSQNEESIERFILSELAYFIDSNTLDNLTDVIEKLKVIAMRNIGFDIGKIAKSRGMNSEDSE